MGDAKRQILKFLELALCRRWRDKAHMTLHQLVACGAKRIGHRLFTLEELYGEIHSEYPDCEIVMHETFCTGVEHTFCIDADYDSFDDWYAVDPDPAHH